MSEPRGGNRDRTIPALKTGLLALGVGGLCLSCSPAPRADVPDAAPTQTTAPKRFDGVSLTVVGLKYPIGNAFEAHAKTFSAQTGAEINFGTVPFGDVYQTIAADYRTGTNRFDVVIYPPIWLPDFVKANYLADLTPRVNQDKALAWDDIVPFFQQYGGTYANKIYGIPVDGDYYMLYYRSDLLAKAGLTPPSTWDDYLAIADQFHGQDLNGDGQPDYGSCLPKQPNHVAWWAFWSIAGSFLQSKGTSQGGFFDLNTFKPLTQNNAFAAALSIYKATGKYGPPGELNHTMDDTRALFIAGRCALTMDHGNTGTLTIAAHSQVVDRVATTLMPGTRQVLDRQTGQLVPCDKLTCPFSIEGVNHAPYAALIGWSAGINQASTTAEQEAAYAFISYVGQPARSNVDVTVGETGFNPYRVSQLTDIETWKRVGMSPTAARQYLGGIGASLSNPNMMLDLTIPNNNGYQQGILDPAIAAFLRGDLNREQTMAQITKGWEALTEKMGRDEQRTIYRTGLGRQP